MSLASIIKRLDIPCKVVVLSPPGHLFNKLPPKTSMVELAEYYSKVIQPELTESNIFWGHSFGGIVSYETLKILQYEKPDLNRVSCLLTSSPPPNWLHIKTFFRQDLCDEDLIEQFSNHDYFPSFDKVNHKMKQKLLYDFRSDLKILEEYRAEKMEEKALLNQAVLFYGNRDKSMGSPKMDHWKRYFPAINIQKLNGAHFFIYQEDAIAIIRESLTKLFSLMDFQDAQRN